ncbi:protein tramtrack, alpha isoform-like isoform X2 [Culicoides brevitarsis]|uniref:protein tramtrack, alpha isoform-like isoform X2 n=1 Tax=Culicoides brevitarsis TaxID=469753 RepID=UPI00307C1ECE
MASQRFCLRWNNHQTNLLSVFDQLLHAETFTDVTLAVEGQYLKAHKMVLSACSPYFQQIFTNHPEKHPIVILKDVPFADMKCLLDFMYRGEVSVDQERLTAFLRVAESLRIKGLTEVNDDNKASCPPSAGNNNSQASQNASQQQSQQQPMTPPPNLHRINPYLLQQQQQQQRQQTENNTSTRNNNTSNGTQNMAVSNPLLGSALSGPKRKRGRPRKLSGSDMGEDYEDLERENLVQGSPEILEVRMGTEGFQQSGNEGSDENGVSRSIDDGDDSSNDVIETSEASHRKSTSSPNAAASTSKGGSPRKDENTSDYSNNKKPKHQQLLPPIIPNLGLLIANKTLESVPGANMHSIKIRVNPMMQSKKSSSSSSNNVSNSCDMPSQSAQDLAQPPTSSTHVSSSPLSEYQQNNITVPIITSVTSLSNNSSSNSQTPTNSSQFVATSSSGNNNTSSGRQPLRRRIRRKGSLPDEQAEQLTEMSVRGLNLFRYASISEGVYKCTECAKDNVQKTFKNKYSFQRHAFLYHEGTQRKVFPCPICSKEFSRPDKMKNHMKTTHDCFVTKDTNNTFPLNFLVGSGGDAMSPNNGPIIMHQKHENDNQQQQQQHANATLEYLRQQSAENSLQLQMIGLNSALSLTMPKLESLLPTTQ